MYHYDVAIVGAGPAGSWLARELARSGISVVLFERSKVAGEPNFSSAGSLAITVEQFNLPQESVATHWNELHIVAPSKKGQWDYPQPIGVVFDFRKLRQLLIAQAKAAGAVISLGSSVTNIQSVSDYSKVCVNSKETEFSARIVVDASGPRGVIASQVGLRKRILRSPTVALEKILEVERLPSLTDHTLQFFVGNRCAPHGYAWIFPMGENVVKVGVCVYESLLYKLPSLDELLTRFIHSFPWLTNVKEIEKHGGFAFLSGGIKNHVKRNVIAIGDAADQINPLGGEGIRHALYSAECAKQVILKVLGKNDLSLLYDYEHLWKFYRRTRWFWSLQLSKLFYGRSSDRAWNFLVACLNRLSPQEVIDIIFEYRFWKFSKLLRSLAW